MVSRIRTRGRVDSSEFDVNNRKPYTYSYYGSHLVGRLRVYHQGGLDTYCGFYAILNLVNFLKSGEESNTFDFLGQPGFYDKEPFEVFNRFVDCGGFRGFFPERPFGDKGLEPLMLRDALSRALSLFYLDDAPKIQDREDPYGRPPHEWKEFFRPGTETPFVNDANGILGLVAVQEDEHDALGHWVVLIGKNRLDGPRIQCDDDWNGIVLDSDRGYELWRYGKEDGKSCLFVMGKRHTEQKRLAWIYSVITV
jgi:hypothetical protein